MQCYGFFNPHFVSSGTYQKISVEVVDDVNANVVGMFAVLYNPASGKTQVQTYDYSKKSRNIRATIYGRQRQNVLECSNGNFDGFKTIKWTKEEIAGFNNCFDLTRACRKFLNEISFSNHDKDDIRAFVCLMKEHFMKISHDMNKQEEPSKTDCWIEVEMNAMNNEDLLEISRQLSVNGMATHKGEYYRLKEQDGNYILQKLTDGNNAKPEFVSVTPCDVRKTIQMAKMKNADGLTEFINGNFYAINTEDYFNGVKYYILLNENGELRKINAKRLEVLSVYDEPPEKE